MWPWVKLDIETCLRAGLSGNRISALSLLAAHANEQQLVTLSYTYLSNRLHVTKRSAFRIIEDLIAAGFLEKLNATYQDRYAVFRITLGASSGKAAPPKPVATVDESAVDDYQQHLIDGMTPASDGE